MITTNWSLGEPTLTGDCATTPQVLTWIDIKKTSYNTGLISGNSEDIRFSYRVQVADFLLAGASVSNSILTTTTTQQDPNTYSDSGTTTVHIPYPDLEVSLTNPSVVQPGDPFSITI